MCYHRGPPSSGIRDAVAAVLGAVDWRPMTVAELDPNAERRCRLGPMRTWGISYDTERRTGKREVCAAGAFGDGAHPTTAMLAQRIMSQSWSGLSVIDLGCGTGVLGLLALQRGASRVSFTDVDNDSCVAVRQAFVLNDLPPQPVFCGSLLDAENEQGAASVVRCDDRELYAELV